MSSVTYIFPAAGKGERFQAAGLNTPKPLIQVHGVPLLIWAISNFQITPSDDVWIISQKKHNLARDLGESWFLKQRQNIKFIELNRFTDGPADTIYRIIDEIDKSKPVVIANTDQFVFEDFSQFINNTKSQKYSGVILTMSARGKKWSYIKRNSANDVSLIKEKEEISQEATVGIYGFKDGFTLKYALEEMFKKGEKVGNEFYVAPCYNCLIERNDLVKAFNIGEIEFAVRGTGTPEDLEEFINDKRTEKIALLISQKYRL